MQNLNVTAIFFIAGSIFIFVLILFIDKLIQNSSLPPKNSLTKDELNRALESLQGALEDNILTNEEYEKLKQEQINKYHST